ncbi:MAG: ATP-dependent zinc metalloprotease FtsH [Clostridia bacterium]|nr:ATP-dependent zinc metalloprotease FtsH [Clostridia bacterium]
MKKSNAKKIFLVLGVIAIIVAIIAVVSSLTKPKKIDKVDFDNIVYVNNVLPDGQKNDPTAQSVRRNELISDLIGVDGVQNAKITTIYYAGGEATFEVTYKLGEANRSMKFSFFYHTHPTTDDLNALSQLGINYSFSNPNSGAIWSYLSPLFSIILCLIIVFFIMRASGGGTKGAINFAKTNARLSTNVKIRFSDVAGAEEEKEELKEIVDFLKAPKKFADLGARIPKGVLMVGPPGTGKTLFAKAVAGEAGVPFFSISGSDFVEMFVGVGASRVRDLFEVAKKSMPCIVFIDEIDAVGRQRGTGLGGGNDEKEQTLNQLLVEMDGFNSNDSIIIMAATNRADILDPALMRPGRFDRQIHVNMPDVRGREAILRVHARNKPLANNVNLKIVARMTGGFSGADLENLLNEAAILAARDNRKAITNKDLYEGINKVTMGPARKSKLVTETDKRLTAYHESGHAVLAKLLKNCHPVHEVTIIPRGQAGGYTAMRPDNDDSYNTKNQFLDIITMSLGGRVAEELVIKDISTGAYGDIRQVTEMAKHMVVDYGMSDAVGAINYGSNGEVFIGRDMASHVTYSEKTASLIDSEVKRIVDEALEKARKLLSENRALLDVMARVLIEKQTIYAEEVNLIMEGKSAEEVIEFMNKNEEALSENPFARDLRKAPNLDNNPEVKEGNEATVETVSNNEEPNNNLPKNEETADTVPEENNENTDK